MSLVVNGWVTHPANSLILDTLVFKDTLITIYLVLLSAVALGEDTPAGGLSLSRRRLLSSARPRSSRDTDLSTSNGHLGATRTNCFSFTS